MRQGQINYLAFMLSSCLIVIAHCTVHSGNQQSVAIEGIAHGRVGSIQQLTTRGGKG
jgi:hypothetical protein